ncbi:hypothetical protein Tco_1418439 [Tanacetum coccineum]
MLLSSFFKYSLSGSSLMKRFHSWDIVGIDVCKAVRDFFANGRILQEINHTILALLPKVPTPTRINDYRPISCCNVIYKVISKLITNRIKEGLQDIVSDNQSAFVPGRSISDNILITQELMHNYHLNKGPHRCAFKIDIQKAYDTVDWKFLRDILGGFGFHPTMVGWIMTCVTSTSFSLCVNGDLHGYFKGRRGLRQGDPMSPYLFTLVMEILTLMLKRSVRKTSVKVIMEALEEFKGVSGLVPSTLPIKYLGVPLISSRLRYRDCKVLVERVQNRINDWKNKYLSFAGRLQLVMSVLSSMHGYWASVFILPAAIIHEIEQLMCGFLWCQGEMKRGKAKVSWESVCLPKQEGGLGIRRLESFNIALMASHIWNIITCKESMWDKVCWRTEDGNLKSFSVGLAWESIRARRDNVPWFHVVWFSACIPRHAFHLWLAMGRKLKTQDKLKQWDVDTSVDLNLLRCPLCKSQPDSHDHLFFSCPYSSQVWLRITNLADMPSTLPMWDDIVDWLLPISKGNSVNSIVGRLILAASTYFVWQERNNRLFAKGERRVNELCEVIAGVVRLKLTTLHFKANARVDKMMAVWKIANTCTNGG